MVCNKSSVTNMAGNHITTLGGGHLVGSSVHTATGRQQQHVAPVHRIFAHPATVPRIRSGRIPVFVHKSFDSAVSPELECSAGRLLLFSELDDAAAG